MRTVKLLSLVALISFFAVSCSSIKVAADYDRQANFNDYKTFAFYKPGVDKAEISDLDKKRILRAVEREMIAKGYTLSENPDVLVSIFTKERDRVNVYNNAGWGWGPYWGPYWGMGYSNVSTTTEGSLYIDIIDAEEKELVWQGKGTGNLVTSGDIDKKVAKINEFVMEIMSQYPPGSSNK
ncbi:protein of unknown function [Zhouia amylolytica]|uniref:DUF4136 domain-containing protein n=2 Tax=Zhouia amylolytica TaxID=376730 RepID=W2UKE5_9FLAO|nr:DUF4136 domain-containing protein [Zhouia amylolytica]ETN93921.1 hypothetical protein P278_33320 [Zhouia amylolytica AD3]MCQ0112496.1 DUF4136 domain-containing protein [Zhouia amylolytica]SFT16423.1 protein of unknown function [Zhouia amylolytica]